jgi:transposase-like protein
MSNVQNPIFADDNLAREWLEARVWPNGPVCPHCGATSEHATRLTGSKHRPGVYQCNACREQFTVTVKTVFERSKVPLSKWLAALFLLTASKKGVSAHQIHRSLNVSYKTAWFMMHRLREAMRQGGLGPLGGPDKIVEADETYFGKVEGPAPTKTTRGKKFAKRGKEGPSGKRAVVSLVERGGRVRSFHPAVADGQSVTQIVSDNIAHESRLMTDESSLYGRVGPRFATHETVKHSDNEYVRIERKLITDTDYIERKVHTNTVEGYFSIFKRGMRGVYQHCKEKHLHRYLAEYDFRYNHRIALGFDDNMRAEEAAKGIVGKRLTYRRPNPARPQA